MHRRPRCSSTAARSQRCCRSSDSICSRPSADACFATSSGAASRRFRQVVAIKIAPFNRYQTLDVLRAVADSGRTDIALYTGQRRPDRARSAHAASPARRQRARAAHRGRAARPVGGVDASRRRDARGDARRARGPLDRRQAGSRAPRRSPTRTARSSMCATPSRDASRACTRFCAGSGCIAGIWCLDPNEGLSPGQLEEIDRVHARAPRAHRRRVRRRDTSTTGCADVTAARTAAPRCA